MISCYWQRYLKKTHDSPEPTIFQCASGQNSVCLKTAINIFAIRFVGWGSEPFLSAGDESVGVGEKKTFLILIMNN